MDYAGTLRAWLGHINAARELLKLWHLVTAGDRKALAEFVEQKPERGRRHKTHLTLSIKTDTPIDFPAGIIGKLNIPQEWNPNRDVMLSARRRLI